MKTEIDEKSKAYKVFNDITLKNEIVIFGSSFTAKFPFYELSQKYYLSNAIYNRSIKDLTLPDAEQILGDCVLAVRPSKIFLSLGEYDNPKDIYIYENIIKKIRHALPSTLIYVLSVKNDEFNALLKSICENTDAKYIHINYKLSCEAIFKQLSCFFRKGRITSADAFCISE